MVLRYVLLALTGLLLCGCTAPLLYEPKPPLQQPVTVLLLDHGRHSSLVIPDQDDQQVRFSYGDWEYYVDRNTGALSSLRAAFLPTSAALGRRQLPGAVDARHIRSQLLVGVDRILPLQVEAAHVAMLREQLDALYQSALDTHVYNAEFDMDFVRHPAAYTLRHNSNYMVALWLQILGVEVRGRAFLSNWQLASE